MNSYRIEPAAEIGRKLHKVRGNRVSGAALAPDSFKCASGFTLLEEVFAAAILIITVVGVMALFGTAFKMSFWQGDPSTRTVEYAQDKMESLLALGFSDVSTDTTV
jgi:hypothetical protein